MLVTVLLFAALSFALSLPSLAGPKPEVTNEAGNSSSTLWDFESGPQDFWGTGDWEWGSPNGGGPSSAHSGSSCWGTNLEGLYSQAAHCYLYSPQLRVLSTNAELTFANWFQFEYGFDGGQVLISTDGASWTILEPIGGYPGKIHLEDGRVLPAFTGFSDGWEEPTFSLGPFAGQEITLQFRMLTNSSYEMSGWFIDDVQVSDVVTAQSTGVEGDEPGQGLPKRSEDASGLGALQFAPGLPNPFREETSLRFVVPDGAGMARTRLEILSVTGRLVTVLADGKRSAGEHVLFWNGRDDAGRAAPPGLYFAHLIVGQRTLTRTIVKLE